MALSRSLVLIATLALALDAQFPSQVQPPVAGRRRVPSTRTIQGVVLDAKDVPVPKAVVLLKDTKTLEVRSYLAGNDGSYHFYGLSFDVNYELRAQANGFTSPQKMISVFDSKALVKLNLKLTKKLKTHKDSVKPTSH